MSVYSMMYVISHYSVCNQSVFVFFKSALNTTTLCISNKYYINRKCKI